MRHGQERQKQQEVRIRPMVQDREVRATREGQEDIRQMASRQQGERQSAGWMPRPREILLETMGAGGFLRGYKLVFSQAEGFQGARGHGGGVPQR